MVKVVANEGMFLGLCEGTVTRRDDPEGLGRVKMIIPGYIEPETPNWVWPLGASGGGFAQHGDFNPPPVGANVGVLFVQGSPDEPRYLPGPWGAPGGVIDTPTDAAIDTDNDGKATRQNAVLEDEEWTIQRDSRTATKKYLIKHKSSSLAVLIDADNDKVALVREGAIQALVRGTEYRTAETGYVGSLVADLLTFATALAAPTILDPGVKTAAGALVTALTTAAADPFVTDATAHLSVKAFTE